MHNSTDSKQTAGKGDEIGRRQTTSANERIVMHETAHLRANTQGPVADGGSDTTNRGKQSLRNDANRRLAAELGISVRAARRIRANDPAKVERRWKSRPNARRDSSWIHARLGYTRADGSLQHIGGVTNNASRRITSSEQQLFDMLLNIDVPRLQRRIASQARKVSHISHPAVLPTARMSAPADRGIRDRRVSEEIAKLVKLAAPDPTRRWRTALAAAIIVGKQQDRSGYGEFRRMLVKIQQESKFVAQLADEVGFDIDDQVDESPTPRRQRRRNSQRDGEVSTLSVEDVAERKAAREEAAAERRRISSARVEAASAGYQHVDENVVGKLNAAGRIVTQ